MKKNYSINWEDDQLISVEVNGIVYNDPDDIPDSDDREAILRLIDQQDPLADEAFDEQAFDAEFDEEFHESIRQLERDSARFPKVIMGVFLLIALILLGITAALTFNITRSLAREESVTGEVVDIVERPSGDGRIFYYPVIEFSLPDEREQIVSLSEGSSSIDYATGQNVTILYDPEQPSQARIESDSSTMLMWIGPFIIGLVGVAFLAAAFFGYWFFGGNPKPE